MKSSDVEDYPNRQPLTQSEIAEMIRTAPALTGFPESPNDPEWGEFVEAPGWTKQEMAELLKLGTSIMNMPETADGGMSIFL